MNKYRLPHIPVGVKIYTLASSMLLLLGGVAAVNAYQIKQVDRKLSDLTTYTLVLRQKVTTVNTHALRQEIYFEKALRQVATVPNAPEKEALALTELTSLGQEVDQLIDDAIALANKATKQSYDPENIAHFSRLEPILNILEEDHQDFQEQAIKILNLEELDKLDDIVLLEQELDRREQRFNQRIYAVLQNLQRFNENVTQQINQHEQELLQWNLLLTGIATSLGLTLAVAITTYLVRPIKQLVNTAKAVEKGDLAGSAKVNSRDEVETLAVSFNTMLEGVRQKDYLQKTFGQYLDPRIVETLLDPQNDCSVEKGGQRATMTIFFSDLAKFSTVSETLTPNRLVELINQYFTLATAPITEFQGVIDKFIGDAIVAFWGPPFVSPEEQAKLACYAALAQTSQLRKLQQMLPDLMGLRKGLPQLGLRVGLDTGEVVVGNVGTEQAKSYTTMGNAVRVAEQLEGLNKRYGTTILITERTRALAGPSVATREVDAIPMGKTPIGKEQTLMPIYELLDYSSTLAPAIAQLCDTFAQGLQAYRQQHWELAQAKFEACLKLQENDGPSIFYLSEIRKRSPAQSATKGCGATKSLKTAENSS
ncbi:MAG: HAMP domain-containing protein [Leptolyngbyaceae cyanobacterium MAG.088]|nr:HAMP domain-containing protein [Leptolyngbyaceae cyanobacterium MAG.088]